MRFLQKSMRMSNMDNNKYSAREGNKVNGVHVSTSLAIVSRVPASEIQNDDEKNIRVTRSTIHGQ